MIDRVERKVKMAFLLHHLLSESAGKYADRPALVCQGHGITYHNLEEISNKIANTLEACGTRRGDRIGIFLPKSIESIAAIFGILKAGGTYVPIASDAPAARVDFILRNCGISRLVSARVQLTPLAKIFQTFPGSHVDNIIWMDSVTGTEALPTGSISWDEVMTADGSSPPETGAIDRDLAYILYTSGSTGDPKGVMISHLNSLTFVNWAQDFFRIGSEDRVANHAPLYFDLSVFDIFATIKAGGTVVIIPDGTSTFPLRLAELIYRERVTVWNSVPSE